MDTIRYTGLTQLLLTLTKFATCSVVLKAATYRQFIMRTSVLQIVHTARLNMSSAVNGVLSYGTV